MSRRSGTAAILRRGDVFPRVRPPDARHSRRPDGVGGALAALPPKATSSRCRRRCWKSFSATRSCCRRSRSTTRRARCCPSEIIRKMKLAGAFGRADWVRSQLYYTTLSLDLHDQDPAGLDLDSMTKRALPEPAAVDVDRGQPHVRELRPSDRLLVELLHLCLRQGHRAGLLRAVRSRTICWAAMPARAIARRCSNRAGQNRGGRWCAIFWAATKSSRRSPSG